ncbi:hypothetical protein BH23ACT5_BH23ACT5_20440 [soil metagenome]
MSEQLAAAAQAMNVPETLVDRSARAWASASGTGVDDVLTAWAGGEVAVPAPSAPEAAASPEPTPEPDPAAVDSSAPAAPVPEVAEAPAAAMRMPEPAPEPVAEPLPLAARVKMAGRVGAWSGAGLGLVGFVVASAWLLPTASLVGEEGAIAPAVEVTTSGVFIGVVLMSILFGILVATLSRAATGWAEPGAELEGRYTVTLALGAILGLVLGVAAGAVMISAFSEAVEGAEGVAVMRIVPSVFVVLIGGGLLGWATAALVQLVGFPVGVADTEADEITDVRGRLASAVSIPVSAIAVLALLVLPLGLTFIRSNELAAGGASVLAIIAAIGILGFAALSASRPTMRVGFGEFMVAVAGIVTVVVIIVSIVSAMAGPGHEEVAPDEPTEEAAGSSTPPASDGTPQVTG